MGYIWRVANNHVPLTLWRGLQRGPPEPIEHPNDNDDPLRSAHCKASGDRSKPVTCASERPGLHCQGNAASARANI